MTEPSERNAQPAGEAGDNGDESLDRLTYNFDETDPDARRRIEALLWAGDKPTRYYRDYAFDASAALAAGSDQAQVLSFRNAISRFGYAPNQSAIGPDGNDIPLIEKTNPDHIDGPGEYAIDLTFKLNMDTSFLIDNGPLAEHYRNRLGSYRENPTTPDAGEPQIEQPDS